MSNIEQDLTDNNMKFDVYIPCLYLSGENYNKLVFNFYQNINDIQFYDKKLRLKINE